MKILLPLLLLGFTSVVAAHHYNFNGRISHQTS
jgi:hypothetical protein